MGDTTGSYRTVRLNPRFDGLDVGKLLLGQPHTICCSGKPNFVLLGCCNTLLHGPLY